jgi:hypothetical protein
MVVVVVVVVVVLVVVVVVTKTRCFRQRGDVVVTDGDEGCWYTVLMVVRRVQVVVDAGGVKLP